MKPRHLIGITCAALCVLPATAAARTPSVFTVQGSLVKGTPRKYDRVQVRRYGSPNARNVLVLVPGVGGGAGVFSLVAPYLVRHVPHLQVWAEMRREGALEDNSVLREAINGQVSVKQAEDFYIGWLTNRNISSHYQPLAAAQFGFVRNWGLAVAMNDLHKVILRARDHGRHRVILGGNSIGGTDAATYPAWDFGGRAGYRDLKGIIEIDGGVVSRTSLTTKAQARSVLGAFSASDPFAELLVRENPWITGPFSELAALAASRAPHAASSLQQYPLPGQLNSSTPLTNQGLLGNAFDATGAPRALFHVQSGHLATSGTPRDWVNAGLTPILNVSRVFSAEPLGAVDWYFPERMLIDAIAAESLRETPAARALGLRLTHRRQVNVPLYAFQTASGGRQNAVIAGAMAYKRLSHIPSVRIVNASGTYAALDPLLAPPRHNSFAKTVIKWLRTVALR